MKRILITYMKNGDFSTESARMVMFEKAKQALKDEGKQNVRTSNFQNGKIVTFDDGSEVIMIPVNALGKGHRYSHIFIDKNLEYTDEGLVLIKQVIFPMLMSDTGNENYDFSGRRLSTFQLVDGEMVIK